MDGPPQPKARPRAGHPHHRQSSPGVGKAAAQALRRARISSALGGGCSAPVGRVRTQASQSPPAVAEKTKEQANAVSGAVVASVNTVATKAVEEVENVALTAGVVRKVRPGPAPAPSLPLGPRERRRHRHPADHKEEETQGPWSVLGVRRPINAWNAHTHPWKAGRGGGGRGGRGAADLALLMVLSI